MLIIPDFDFHDINFCLMEFCGVFLTKKDKQWNLVNYNYINIPNLRLLKMNMS